MSALIPDVVLHLLLHLAGAGQAVEDGEPQREVEQLGERETWAEPSLTSGGTWPAFSQ